MSWRIRIAGVAGVREQVRCYTSDDHIFHRADHPTMTTWTTATRTHQSPRLSISRLRANVPPRVSLESLRRSFPH